MQKIINVICHPSMIALYFNEKVYKIIIMLVSFFAILSSIVVAYSFKSEVYGYEFTSTILDSVISKTEPVDLVFKNSTLTGKTYIIKGEGIYIYFSKSDFAHNDYGLVLNFKENQVDVYYRYLPKKTVNYSDMGISDFTFSDVKYNKNNARINFENLISLATNSINDSARVLSIFDNLIHVLIMYLVVVVICNVFSFFVNPLIKFQHRIRICLYDSMIYFVLIIFSLMFQAVWLEYVALVLPMIYCNISFRKIVVIKR